MKEHNIDVTALGELLIDFTESGMSEQGNPLLEANPGGSVCNVLAMLSKLGKSTAYIGKVGKDQFGRQLKDALNECGIDTANLQVDETVPTTLAFVHTFLDGDREFSFYRNPGADMMLRRDEVNEELIKRSRAFHFSTLSSTHEGVRAATRYALDVAIENGLLISFDPNLRPPLWESLDQARKEIEYGMSKCDVLKLADNEIEFITGTQNYTEGVQIIREKYDIPLIFVTLGKEGSRAYYGDRIIEAAAFLRDDTVDTTGAGDVFAACALNYLLDHGLSDLSDERIKELLTFANAAASIITSRKGALRMMPEPEEIRRVIAGRN